MIGKYKSLEILELPKPLKSLKLPKSTWIMGTRADLLKSLKAPKMLRFFNSRKSLKIFKLLKPPKTLKLLKSLRLFVAIAPLVFLFGGCIGSGWFVPYSFQPSYHKFKKICELNVAIYENPNDQSIKDEIFLIFNVDLKAITKEKKQSIFIPFKNNRIDADLYIQFNDNMDITLIRIRALYGNAIYPTPRWDTKRFYLGWNTSYNIEFYKKMLDCNDVL